MATLNPQESSGLLDQNIPQWKRELILKRRALGRTLQAGNVCMKLTRPAGVSRNDDSVAGVRIGNASGIQQRCTSSVIAVVPSKSSLDQNVADFHPGHSSTGSTGSVLNMRYVDSDHRPDGSNGVGLVDSGCVLATDRDKVMLDNNCAFKCVIGSNKMGEEKSIIIKRPNSGSTESVSDNYKCDGVKRKQNRPRPNPVKSVVSASENKTGANTGEDDDGLSDSSEELKYGPGIVNKLKTKYLSMTLRENQKRGVRPSLSNLRRATSLENMLEDDLKTQQQNIIVTSPRSTNPNKFSDKNSCSNKTTNKSAAVSVNYQYNLNRRVYGRVNGESIMKRACSMDTLLHGEVQSNKSVVIARLNKTIMDKDGLQSVGCIKNIAPSIANEDLIIVEHSNKVDSNLLSNEESKVATSQQLSTRSGIKNSTSVEEKELPPPDVVKQTLKKFESGPRSKTSVTVQKKIKVVNVPNSSNKPYRTVLSSSSNTGISTSSSASSSASISSKDKSSLNKPNSNKPILSPKPVLSPEKCSSLHRNSKITSPKRNIKAKTENVNSDRPTSRQKSYSKFGAENNSISGCNIKEVITSVVDNSVISDVKKQTRLPSSLADSNTHNVSPVVVSSNDSLTGLTSANTTLTGFNKTVSFDQNLPKLVESNDVVPSTSVLLPEYQQIKHLEKDNNIDGQGSSYGSKDLDETDNIGDNITKSISNDTLENIRRGGTSVKFNFKNDENSENNSSVLTKSHLPVCKEPPALQATNTALLLAAQTAPVVKVLTVPLKQDTLPVSTTQMKQVGVIRPILSSSKIQQNISVAAVKPLSCNSSLTDLEIEKNLINSVKSIEQPVSKVVVAIKTLPDSVVLGPVQTDLSSNKAYAVSSPRMANTEVKNRDLWSDKKPWHQNQNTMIFNFSDRKDVPDYIENDGLILRGKRERPKPGDGGFIFLGGNGGRHESSTDDAEEESGDDWSTLADDPPSPCDVTFVNDNILINGKSNLRKHPRQHKLRIQFKEEPTTFEYPSESSLAEQMSAASSTDEHDHSTHFLQRPKSPPPKVPVNTTASASSSSSPSIPSAPCLGSSSLASYTPSKLGRSEGWQPGVTRHTASVHASATRASNSKLNSGESATTGNADYLKPATPEQTVAWSEETTADLLF